MRIFIDDGRIASKGDTDKSSSNEYIVELYKLLNIN